LSPASPSPRTVEPRPVLYPHRAAPADAAPPRFSLLGAGYCGRYGYITTRQSNPTSQQVLAPSFLPRPCGVFRYPHSCSTRFPSPCPVSPPDCKLHISSTGWREGAHVVAVGTLPQVPGALWRPEMVPGGGGTTMGTQGTPWLCMPGPPSEVTRQRSPDNATGPPNKFFKAPSRQPG